MKPDVDLKRIERGAYLFHHQDGLLDIAVGLILVGGGFMIALDRVALWFIFYFLGIAVWRAAKKWITYPRIGYVKFPAEPKGRTYVLAAVVVAALLFFLVLSLIALSKGPDEDLPLWLNALLSKYIQMLIGSMLALIIIFVAYHQRVYRLYIYAAFAFVVFAISQFADTTFWWSIVLVGAFIMLVGLGLLFRFVSKYRKQNANIDGTIQ